MVFHRGVAAMAYQTGLLEHIGGHPALLEQRQQLIINDHLFMSFPVLSALYHSIFHVSYDNTHKYITVFSAILPIDYNRNIGYTIITENEAI